MDLIPSSPHQPPSASMASHFIPFAFPGVPHIACVFTTSLAGTMSLFDPDSGENPVANRQGLMARLAISRWVELQQVHGTAILVDPDPSSPEESPETKADGSCTKCKGTALAIKTADCQPILFTDKKGSAIAALHVGWRGNAADFPAIGLARFCETYHIHPKDVLAVRGPSLGPGAAEFVNFEKEWPAKFSPWFNQTQRSMDLWSLTRHQLVEAGMLPEHVFSLDLCTWSLPELFYSYRRGHSGRQMSLIWIKE